jgi:competence protein ComEC
VATLPAPWFTEAVHAALAAVARALTARIEAERGRSFLWLPVALGAGVGGYFVLPYEPVAWAAPVIVATTALLGLLLYRRVTLSVACLALTVSAAGFALAQWRTHAKAAPVLAARWGPGEVTGRVVNVEYRPEGRRVILDRLHMPGLSDRETPGRVRVRLQRNEPALRPGDRIRVRARVLPPPAPAAPGAFDFQQVAWFLQLGGVGQAIGDPALVSRDEPGGFWLAVNEARQAVVERVMAALPSAAGAIAAALLTGEQGVVPADVLAAMRDSGLAHILSISGLHISLVAAFVFLVVRRGLALAPAIALRFAIKKWAALIALVAITFYTFFAAPGVPTQRAWLMGTIALLAIMIDRLAITMRLVAWAGLILIAILPESLLSASFQMSFAAVVALISVWEALRERLVQWRADAGIVRRFAIVILAGASTSLVAGLASAPYALYHFNRFSAFGLIANLLAMPLTGLWIMPWVVITFVLLPFGLEAYALAPMAWGIEGLLGIARMVAGWPGAVALWPAMPWWGLAITTLGGLWLCIWRSSWRWWGAPVAVCGVASMLLVRPPDILIAGDASLIAVRGADGQLHFSATRGATIARETWLRRDGQEAPVAWPAHGVSADGRLACDRDGCVYSAAGHVVALARHAEALAEDCRQATILIALVAVRRPCPSPRWTIDRRALLRDGGHAVRLGDGGAVEIESVRGVRGDRPWVPADQRRTAPPPAQGPEREDDPRSERDGDEG